MKHRQFVASTGSMFGCFADIFATIFFVWLLCWGIFGIVVLTIGVDNIKQEINYVPVRDKMGFVSYQPAPEGYIYYDVRSVCSLKTGCKLVEEN